MKKCEVCGHRPDGTKKYKTMYGYIVLCPECKAKREAGLQPTDVDFDEMVQRIGRNEDGTLVIICGNVGGGKTTLALKMLRAFNDGDYTEAVISTDDVHSRDMRAYLLDDILVNNSEIERIINRVVCENQHILITTAHDIGRIPREYRALREYKDPVMHDPGKGIRSICVINLANNPVDDKRQFTVRWTLRKSWQDIECLTACGHITREDAEEMSEVKAGLVNKAISRGNRDTEPKRGDGYMPDYNGTEYFTCPRCGCGEFDSFPQTVPADRSVRWTYEHQCARCKTIIGLTLRGNDRSEKE